jgi:tetratricopeptide (TPR) repeat protein
MRRFLASAVVVAAILGAPDAARGDPREMDRDAKRELERGLDLFDAGDYDDAIEAFDAGIAIDPHPDFLYAKAQAQRMNGECDGAIETYRGFLATSPPAKEAKPARFNIERCEKELERLRRNDNGNGGNGNGNGNGDRDGADRVHPPWYRDALGGVLAAGAVIGLAAGATLYLIADRHVDYANDSYDLEEYYYELDLVESRRLYGTISLVVGGALATGAIIRYATRPSGRVQVTGAVTASGATLVVGGRF